MNLQPANMRVPMGRPVGTDVLSSSPVCDPPSPASVANPGYYSEDPYQNPRVASPYVNASLGSAPNPYAYPSVNGPVAPCPACMMFSCELTQARNSLREMNVRLIEKSSLLSHSEALLEYHEKVFQKKEEECKRLEEELKKKEECQRLEELQKKEEECQRLEKELRECKEQNKYLEGVKKKLEQERDGLQAANYKLEQQLKTSSPLSSNSAGVTSSQSHIYSQEQDTSSKKCTATKDHPIQGTFSEDKITSSSAEYVTKKLSSEARPWNNSDVRPSRSWSNYKPKVNEGKPLSNSDVFQERIQRKSDSFEEPQRKLQENVFSRSGISRGADDSREWKPPRNPEIDSKRRQPYSSSSNERSQSTKPQQMHSKDVRDNGRFPYDPQLSPSISSDCIKEIKRDLFDMPSEYSLAHCVASDFLMSSGVAVEFRKKYRCTPELLEQHKKPGQVAFLEKSGQYIYYLVTKVNSHDKPKWENFERSVIEWRSLCEKHGVKQIAIPRIGCGRDHLEWSRVKRLLDHQFSRAGIEITICNIEEEKIPEKKCNLKLIHCKKPVSEIDPRDCALVFIASCDHIVTESLSKLATKFGFSSDYVKNQYSLGSLYHYRNKAIDANVCGLVAKECHTDPISFRALARCLQDLKRVMKKSDLWYIGFEAFDDPVIEIVTKKTWTVFTEAFFTDNFEVHFCWPDYVKESCWED